MFHARFTHRALMALGLTAGLALAALPAREAAAAVSITATVSGIEAAENGIQTTGGRIFVSSDGYLYELHQTAGVWAKTVVPANYPADSYATDPAHADRKSMCYYLGLTVAGAALRPVVSIAGTASNPIELPNGLASDGRGNLFFANTPLPSLTPKPGNIQRIQLSGRFSASAPTQVVPLGTHAVTTLAPNGVKFNAGNLYVTANPPSLSGTSLLVRIPVTGAGTLGAPWTVYSGTTFLDDFSLVQDGMVIIEWITGTMKFINEAGGLLRSYQYPFSFPTSATVLRAGTSAGNAVLVTSMGSDKAAFLATDWPITPR